MKRKPLIMTFSRLAEGYLGERIVSATYAANLRRVAVRAGEVTMERTNAYLRQRAGAGRLHLGHRSPALFEQAYCDWSQLRKNTPRTPAIL